MNCYLFGKLIFKSYISESLDFEETRILKILQVLNNTVEIEIEDTDNSDHQNVSETSFLKPIPSRNPKDPKNSKVSRNSRIFKLKFEDFENLLKTNSELCVIDDSISKIFLKDLSMFNPKFSYSRIKTFLNA